MIRIDEIPADIGVIERIAARDEHALGELYDRYSRLLFGLILRILPDRGEAEAALQDVFALVWTRAESYTRSLGSPAAWLVRLARNRAVERRRAERGERRPGEAPTPIEDATNRVNDERQPAVIRALDVIPSDQRILIEEAFYGGLTETELAERFELPLGTVKTRIRSGMLTLRQQLSQIAIQQ
jgi:RNA polymerase sigma-70 factor (ECF subfamily)